jgi:hypothetical protein
MILLSILLTPLGIAALFIVMSWTERVLDHQTCRQPTPTGLLTTSTLLDGRPVVEVAARIEAAVAR